jgi:hypothetical protein
MMQPLHILGYYQWIRIDEVCEEKLNLKTSFWEADNHSAAQEITCLQWNMKVHYSVQMGTLMLSQLNPAPVHALTHWGKPRTNPYCVFNFVMRLVEISLQNLTAWKNEQPRAKFSPWSYITFGSSSNASVKRKISKTYEPIYNLFNSKGGFWRNITP